MRRILPGVALLVLLSVQGCGGGDSSGGSVVPPPPPPPPPPPATSQDLNWDQGSWDQVNWS